MERIKINRRVTLNYIFTEKSKSDRLSIYFRDALNETTVAANALLMPTLLSGCEEYPDMKSICVKLQTLYGASVISTNLKRGNEQIFGLTSAFVSRRFTLEGEDTLFEMSKLLGLLLQKPLVKNNAFPKDYVKIEKNNLITDIRAEINDKGTYARKQCMRSMCEGDSFVVESTEKGVKKITPQSLYDHYLRVMNQCPVEIFYVGTEPKERLQKVLSQTICFSDGDGIVIPKAKGIAATNKIKTVTEKMDVTQGKLALGFTTDITSKDQGFSAMALCIAMYGGTPTSKLFMNVREKLSLCYTCSASYTGAKGVVCAMAGIDFEKKEQAQAEMLHQLDCLKQGDFTEEELNLSRNALVSALRTVADSPDDLITWWLSGICMNSETSLEERIAEYMAVTREDILASASHINLNTVYFLDGKGAKA